MIQRPQLGLFSTVILLLLLGSGCREPAAGRTPASPDTRATEAASSPEEQPQRAGQLRLLLPATVTGGEVLTLQLANETGSAFVLYPAHGDSCLDIRDAAGAHLQLKPPLTCDLLAELIVGPGEQLFVGTWDLRYCPSLDCPHRQLVEKGIYTVFVTAYPYTSGDSAASDAAQTLEAQFRVD